MSDQTPVRIFIGSGEASRLERKTLIYSLKKHSRRPLDIAVFNGTHNTIEREGKSPVVAPMSLDVKYRNLTEFTHYRWLIPQLCGHQGRALWLDSDIIALCDIGELFDLPMENHALLARPAGEHGSGRWGLSVVLFDCARCRFDLDTIFSEIDRGLYTEDDFLWLAPAFRKHHPIDVGVLEERWNMFDRHDATTKLIHYTHLMMQPWKFPRHPYGELWFDYFREAQAAGAVTEKDIQLSILRAYVRPDIQEGNSPSWFKRTGQRIRRRLGRLLPARTRASS